jgi:Zn finger protein HypA/HybF involved in hydrogenase expression
MRRKNYVPENGNSIIKADTEKKQLSCLRCNRMMATDRCHRICKKCHRANNATYDKPRMRASYEFRG